jgi:hypothetical protein
MSDVRQIFAAGEREGEKLAHVGGSHARVTRADSAHIAPASPAHDAPARAKGRFLPIKDNQKQSRKIL